MSVFFPKVLGPRFLPLQSSLEGSWCSTWHTISITYHFLSMYCVLCTQNSILGDHGWTWAWMFMHRDRTVSFLQMYVGTPACTSVHSVYRTHEKHTLVAYSCGSAAVRIPRLISGGCRQEHLLVMGCPCNPRGRQSFRWCLVHNFSKAEPEKATRKLHATDESFVKIMGSLVFSTLENQNNPRMSKSVLPFGKGVDSRVWLKSKVPQDAPMILVLKLHFI